MLLWLLRGCFAVLMLTLAVFAFTFCTIDLPDTMGTAEAGERATRRGRSDSAAFEA